MTIRFKHFHDNVNTVVIVAPGCEFFPAKYGQFPFTLTKDIKRM